MADTPSTAGTPTAQPVQYVAYDAVEAMYGVLSKVGLRHAVL